MEPDEIWGLILKADEKVKYATDDRAELRATQAVDILTRALDAAREIGNDQLAAQAQRRLDDLGTHA